MADIDINVDISVNGKIQVVVSGKPMGALPWGNTASDYRTKDLQYTNGLPKHGGKNKAISQMSSCGHNELLATDDFHDQCAFALLLP